MDSITAISSVSSLLRRHSHLYLLMLQWFHQHSGLLTSSRTAELLSHVSRCLRGPTDHRICQRSLLNHVSLDPQERPPRRSLVLKHLAQSVKHMQQSETIDRSSLIFEWMGLLERPHLVQETIASLFCTDTAHSRDDAALVISWHYAFSHEETADVLSAIVLETSTGLNPSNAHTSNLWLQRHRSEFATAARVRLKLVWFWLLQVCWSKAESDEQIEDVLKSVEYVFRRFAPSDRKR